MKLLRLKITDSAGFRSLPCGFEHHFRTEWNLQDELDQPEAFAPFVCAGPNGSGKSNLLEVLGAVFYQLELQRVRRSFLPDVFQHDPVENPQGIREGVGFPDAFELEYLIYLPTASLAGAARGAHVRVQKVPGESPRMFWVNAGDAGGSADGVGDDGLCGEQHRDFLLPAFVLGYSSGENEILSLPFFKMRFLQFDQYWANLKSGRSYVPETRMTYLDSGFSQAILLCNLLFSSDGREELFTRDIGIESLKEFRIVLRRSVLLDEAQARPFIPAIERTSSSGDDERSASRPVVLIDGDTGLYRLDVLRLLQEQNPDRSSTSSLALDALRRCATLVFEDAVADTLVLDYWVNDATRQAFRESFDGDPRVLFQAFQLLLTLNLYTVSDTLKADLYRSDSHYVSETVPRLASDERVMRFKFVRLFKQGVAEPLTLKSLSDGEHQLLHTLGLCLLFRETSSLFLLDEPETHFNPDWRASFISRLRQGLRGPEGIEPEMLITTHSPFLISDSRADKVLVFAKDKASGAVGISHPDYNTLGASINKITMNTFGKRETIGGRAQALLETLRARFEHGAEDSESLIDEVQKELGDSVEKVLLIRAILDGQSGNDEAKG
jgi:restriction system-associated AAA family ATPase